MKQKGLSKYSIIVFIAFGISLLALFILQNRFSDAWVKLSDEHLHVLVANNPKQLHKGLGGRETLEPYDGMLFLFPFHRKHGIVMRDMQFSLDIIWLDGGEVVDIAPNVPTEPGAAEHELMVYQPRVEANTVLEVPGGWVYEHDIQIGDRLVFVDD